MNLTEYDFQILMSKFSLLEHRIKKLEQEVKELRGDKQ